MKLVGVRPLLLAAVVLLPQWIWADSKLTQLTNLPTVYIETDGHRSITSKEQYISCTITIVDGDSTAVYPNTEIRGRGNSTWWNSEKKPYRIKFATKQKLLGRHFANARSWTLLANHGDKTMIRNALTYDLGRFIGMDFCPAARFVDLYLNGSYRGTYQISDQVQAHKRRIDISEDDGWILEVANENSHEDPYITSTVYRIMYNLKNPKDDALTMQKRIAIGQWIEAMERAVKSDAFADPEQGYRAYFDEESLINWYVGAEITGNIDALYSIYMYKDSAEQRMHFGPLWDLDIGYDNSSERSLLRAMEAYLGLWNRPFEKILQRLWQDPWFANACTERLNQLINNGLQQYLLDHIDSLRNVIYQSQARNYEVWRINQQVFSFAKNRYHLTYDEYIDDLRQFVNIHIPYLQQAFETRRQTAAVPYSIRRAETDDPARYDLQGRRTNNPTGVYIKNHRKYIP